MTNRHGSTRARLLAILAPLALIAAACGAQQPSTPAATQQVSSRALAAESVLYTFDSRYVQVDACPNNFPPLNETPGCGTFWSGDANLFTGNDHDLLLSVGKTVVDPPVPSKSADWPVATGSPVYIDWDDLTVTLASVQSHFRSDFDPTVGPDASAFPGSNSCVGPANVLDKMNLTFVSVSNNTKDAFFGVQRRDNSGDAGYMWIFNKIMPPSLGNEEALKGTNDGLGDNCSATTYPLTFRVSKGDVLFRGHFAPSSDMPLLSVYKVLTDIVEGTSVKDGNTVFTATCPASGPCYIEMPAKSAINWRLTIGNTTDLFWVENATYIAGAAANTGIAGLGALGDTSAASTTGGMGKVGLKSLLANNASYTVKSTGATWKCTDPNGCMQENLFAEVAVDITAFIESGACGATFYGSVISRSSGTTPSPDMKDLAGPYEFNFGSASVTAVVAPTCGTGTDAQFNYKIGTYTGFAGGTVDLSTCGTSGCACKWFLDGATTEFSTDCNYTNVLKAVTGSNPHTLKLEATDGFCPATATISNINVSAPPTVSATMSAGCVSPLAFTYGSTPSGVVGTAGYAWTFTGGYTGSSTSQSGSVSSGITAKTQIDGEVTLTDTRNDPLGNLACTAKATANATAYLPIGVTISPKAAPQTCTTMTSDAVTFLGSPSGGSGSYTYVWKDGTGAALVGVCTEASPSTECTIDPADGTFCASQTLKLTVSDSNFGTTGCDAKTSNAYTYGKVTTVTATAVTP